MSNNLNRSRVVVNKYTDTPSDITSGVCSDGEIVISTKKGNEGLYIKNNEGEILKIIGKIADIILAPADPNLNTISIIVFITLIPLDNKLLSLTASLNDLYFIYFTSSFGIIAYIFL